MKNIILLVVLFFSYFQLLISQDNNPPFNKGMVLKTNNYEFILGYSLRNEIIRKMGNPQNTIKKKYGGEDWNWKNMTIDEYQLKKFTLVYSDSDKLIQIIFKPSAEDKYTSIFNITDKTTIDELIKILDKNKVKYSKASKEVLWIDYFTSKVPMFNVTCGFEFNNQNRISIINYAVDGPW